MTKSSHQLLLSIALIALLSTNAATNAASTYFKDFLGDGVTDEQVKDCLTNSPDLKNVLFMSTSKVSDTSLAYLANLKDLQIIKLNKLKISGNFLKDLNKLPALAEIEISDTTFNEDNLKYISKSKILRLNLRGSSVANIAAWYISFMQALRQLDLSESQIDDRGVEFLLKMSNLRCLYLRETSITDKACEILSQIQTLSLLDLRKNNISNAGLKDLSKLPALDMLLIGNPQISDEGVKCLAGNKTITDLNLSDSQISDGSLQTLLTLPKLKTLYIQRTNIDKNAVIEFKKLRPNIILIGPDNPDLS